MSRMSELQLSGTGETVLILVSVLGVFLIGVMFGFLICFYSFACKHILQMLLIRFVVNDPGSEDVKRNGTVLINNEFYFPH